MASTNNSTHHDLPVSTVFSPSKFNPPTPSQKGRRTHSPAGASGDAGHVGASCRENCDEKGEVLFARRGNYNRRATVSYRRGKTKCCLKEAVGSGAKFAGDDYLETDDEVALCENTLHTDRHEPKPPRHAVKRFKRGVQQHVCNNDKMHPRNRHRGVFLDYWKLAEKYPFLKPYIHRGRFGQCNVNFRDPLALYYLSKAILKEFYSLEFQMPVDQNCRYLIPCVPSRANYLHHIADLLVDVDVEATAYLKGDIPGIATKHEDRNDESNGHKSVADRSEFSGIPNSTPLKDSSGSSSSSASSNPGTSCISDFSSPRSSSRGDKAAYPLQGDRVAVLDIGVGANCIYPLLGVREYGWRFVGSDVSEASLAVAEHNVQLNALEHKISLRLQPRRENCFSNIVRSGEFYCLTMCNPPFHRSREEANVCPVRTLEAQDHEILCDGGESQFISNLIEESKTVCAQVLWFTTLVARAATVKEMKKHLWEELRCFSHKRQQQQELMERLWMERGSTVKATNSRSSEGTPADDVTESTRRSAASTETGPGPATASSVAEITHLEEHQRGKKTKVSTHEGKDTTEKKTTSSASREAPTEEREECGEHVKTAVKEGPASISYSSDGKREFEEGENRHCKACVRVCEFRVKELLQGKQTRWVICWTYWSPEQRKMVRRAIEETQI